MSIRVLIVDDNPVIRDVLSATLEREPEIEVVGSCADGLNAVATASLTKPDVVLMDLVMPGMNGIEATRLITESELAGKVVVLTAAAEDAQVREMLAAGAATCVFKEAGLEVLLGAIRTASPRILGSVAPPAPG